MRRSFAVVYWGDPVKTQSYTAKFDHNPWRIDSAWTRKKAIQLARQELAKRGAALDTLEATLPKPIAAGR